MARSPSLSTRDSPVARTPPGRVGRAQRPPRDEAEAPATSAKILAAPGKGGALRRTSIAQTALRRNLLRKKSFRACFDSEL